MRSEPQEADLIEIDNLRYRVFKRRGTGPRATVGQQESGTNQAARRS